ncbi:MAG: TrkA family potassium uptake protein [Epsilonproteobacteria bacterium]|nr:TrkA family potassium uptake protein [Campylobacterota bacterium]
MVEQKKDVLIFGYGRFGRTIANSIREYGTSVRVAVIDREEFKKAKSDKFEAILFDLESDETILSLNITESLYLVCAMDNNHENLFLTLSLRDLFPKNYIIAISDSIHVSDKLKMAGANRVIDIYTISANIIKHTLTIPVATKFLQGFINKSHGYIFKEIKIGPNSPLNGKKLSEIDFERYNIIFIGMIDEELGNQFVFNTVGFDHKIDPNDIIVVVGKEEDIKRFELECGG